ncbi:MAG: inositol-3-phosphate synthase [Candidatus Ranarchaeia archaeon]
MPQIRVAIAGLGNCASSLIQGLYYYANVDDDAQIPGLMHANFGGYHISDIKIVAAFDVNTKKIGHDVSQAIFASPNSVPKFSEVPVMGVNVEPAPILDGVAEHMRQAFNCYDPKEISPCNIVDSLKKADADILVNYLPVGSKEATIMYAQAAIDSGTAFVNCIPEFIVSDPGWQQKFMNANLPCAGDDVKSQVGATILHRAIVSLFKDRGVHVTRTYQLNIGGNTDFENMRYESRLATKRISKTQAVKSLVDYDLPTRIGPSDFVEFLGDNKICYIRLEGEAFARFPIHLDVKLSVEDSPNSAGVVIDVIRATKLALDRHIAGPLTSISSYSFKHPPEMIPDDDAKKRVEDFIAGKIDR